LIIVHVGTIETCADGIQGMSVFRSRDVSLFIHDFGLPQVNSIGNKLISPYKQNFVKLSNQEQHTISEKTWAEKTHDRLD
jgi:hypothetical protein